MVATGPAIPHERSRTVTPASTPAIASERTSQLMSTSITLPRSQEDLPRRYSMPAAQLQRLFSSDDHADLTQDQVKRHLHPKHHDSYDAAVAQVEAELRGRNNVEVNRRWREQQNLEQAQTKGFGGNERHPAFGRAGH